jgi:hypothetical protein
MKTVKVYNVGKKNEQKKDKKKPEVKDGGQK